MVSCYDFSFFFCPLSSLPTFHSPSPSPLNYTRTAQFRFMPFIRGFVLRFSFFFSSLFSPHFSFSLPLPAPFARLVPMAWCIDSKATLKVLFFSPIQSPLGLQGPDCCSVLIILIRRPKPSNRKQLNLTTIPHSKCQKFDTALPLTQLYLQRSRRWTSLIRLNLFDFLSIAYKLPHMDVSSG